MSEKIPTNIYNLAEKNYKLLQQLKYASIITMVNYDFSASQKLGEKYMDKVLPRENFVLKEGEYNSVTEIPVEKHELIEDLISKNIALILVRPEMLHIHRSFAGFIEDIGLKVFYTSERIVSYDQYWTLYKGSIRFPEAVPSMPTRTMVYTHSPCVFIAFVDPQNRHSNLADFFERKYKGKAGVVDKQSLRGGVVYPEAKKLGFDTLHSEVVAGATDPFFGYRHLVDMNNQGISIEHHENILKYNAVSVHIPNSREIPYDLSTLNTVEQLEEINKELRVCLTGI